jgi:hypothetical protein
MVWGKIQKEAASQMPPEEAEEVLGWQKLIPAHVGFRCMSLGMIKHKEGYRSAFTLVCACEKAVDLGAKHIRILGADMDGPSVVDEPHGSGGRKSWDRWSYEREQLGKMIAAAAEVGVEIELAHN